MHFFHLFNRGVEKRDIFIDDADRVRFIHDLYEFNDTAPAPAFCRRVSNKKVSKGNQKRERLINIYAFCLMPNHHHLLCEEILEGGVSLFMKKLHGGYARAFNEKHKRSGYLFQGRFKRVLMEDERQLFQTLCYIHANPLDLWRRKWKEKRLSKEDLKKAVLFLEKYRWSSHLDYLGKRNFPSILSQKFLTDIIGGGAGYSEFFENWLSFFEDNVSKIRECVLD